MIIVKHKTKAITGNIFNKDILFYEYNKYGRMIGAYGKYRNYFYV